MTDVRDLGKEEKPDVKQGYLQKAKSYVKFYLEQCRYAKQTLNSGLEYRFVYDIVIGRRPAI